MSGTNLKCIIVCKLLFSFCYGISWHYASIVPDHNDKVHPAVFVDTLSFSAAWSPVYPGFDIQEGRIYFGTSSFDISLKSQYHRLMSNHQLSIGFPILSEDKIKAGLQVHYTLSLLHGVENQHMGSCSGGLIIRPQTTWQVSLFSTHILSFPRDSSNRLLEPELLACFSYKLLPCFSTSISFKKCLNLTWRSFLCFEWNIVKNISLGLAYEIGKNNLSLKINIGTGRFKMKSSFALHSYLGLTQGYEIAYEY